MPDTYGPFDGVPWPQAQWYRDFGYLLPVGVPGTPAASPNLGELGLTSSGLTVTMALGRAHVRGAGYERTATAYSANAATAHATLARIDRLVLRRDLAAKTIVPTILTGTPSGSPAAPALTQADTTVWDMPLFSWTVAAAASAISAVVDERIWLDPNGRTTRLALTPASGWSAQAARPIRLWLDAEMSVHLEGLIVPTNTFDPTTGVQLLTIPVGYRPPGFTFPTAAVNTGGGVVTLQIDPTSGAVTTKSIAGATQVLSGTFMSLDMISWPITTT